MLAVDGQVWDRWVRDGEEYRWRNSVDEYRWIFSYMERGIRPFVNIVQGDDNRFRRGIFTSLHFFGLLFQGWMSWGCDLYSRLRSSGDRWSGTCHDEGGGCRWFSDAVMLVVVSSNLQPLNSQNYPSLIKVISFYRDARTEISSHRQKNDNSYTSKYKNERRWDAKKASLRKTRLFRVVVFFLESSFLTRW